MRAVTFALMAVLLSAPVDAGASADATWKTHQDQNCGIELRYPPSHILEASGPRDHCEPWITIGVRGARGLRALFSIEIREAESSSGPSLSARDFAVQVATAWCAADGPEGSTYCTDGEVRSTFRTRQGFRGFEIGLTEVHETFSPEKIEKRRRGPIFALDLSDDEVVRVLVAGGEPARLGELKAILDTFRVWTRARRLAPRVVEMNPFHGAPQAFVLRVTTAEPFRGSRWPPSPVTSWLLIDPQGRRLGRDSAMGNWHSEVPAVTISTAVESGFMLRESMEGRYELQVTASVPSVPYQVVVQAPDQAGKPTIARHPGRTPEPGAVDRYAIVYSRGSAPAVAIAEVADSWRFSVLLSSRRGVTGDLILTDPRGQPVGLRRDIPDAGTGTRGVVIDVRQPMDGSYMLQVNGIARGSYTLDLRAWDRSGRATARPELRDVPTGPGVAHVYRLDYAVTAGAPLKLGAPFERDRLFAFASPASAETELEAGVTSFPLAIFYGARIEPVTFNALLNGDNISGRFTPAPAGYQVVRIPLAAGVNTLVLSVEGVTDGDRTATDRYRLVFRVK